MGNEVEATLLRLGPYSPMLNPTENIWSKIKTYVKTHLRVPQVRGIGIVEQRLLYLEEIIDSAKETILQLSSHQKACNPWSRDFPKQKKTFIAGTKCRSPDSGLLILPHNSQILLTPGHGLMVILLLKHQLPVLLGELREAIVLQDEFLVGDPAKELGNGGPMGLGQDAV
nr:unnamed protein product [Callosobruchus analis]